MISNKEQMKEQMKEQITTNVSNAIIISNKPQFIENMQKWVAADSQLKRVQEKTKQLRDYRNQLNDQICKYVEENNLIHKKIEIHDGEIKFYDKKDYSPLTYAYIEECLANIILDKSHVDYILKYLKEHREIKTTTDIRRTYNKNTSISDF